MLHQINVVNLISGYVNGDSGDIAGDEYHKCKVKRECNP